MGYDAYASENGELEFIIRSYEDNRFLGRVCIVDLEPREKISIDYMEGEPR